MDLPNDVVSAGGGFGALAKLRRLIFPCPVEPPQRLDLQEMGLREVYPVDIVDMVDYKEQMKAETPFCDMTPAGVPSKRAPSIDAGPRFRGAIKVIFTTIHGFHSASRREILKAAKKHGYADAEVNAALDYLVKTPVLPGSADQIVSTPPAASAPAGFSDRPVFDPSAAGERFAKDLQASEGGTWSGQELQSRFNLTPATLHRRRKEHRIIYLRDARHDFHYPKWQFTPSGALLPGIQEVLTIFQSQDEWRIMRYFLGKRAQLADLRPLDLLRDGEKEKVLAHAKMHAEENTW